MGNLSPNIVVTAHRISFVVPTSKFCSVKRRQLFYA